MVVRPTPARLRSQVLQGRPVLTPSVPNETTRATLTTPKIVFIIVAAAAPLGAIVLTVPLMFAKGNGPGVPIMFLVAGLTLLLFAFGYAAMARLVSNSGAFYTYIARGLGKRAGVAAAFVAVVAYNAQTVGIVGGFAYAAQLGIGVPWYVAAFVLIALVGLLGYRNVDVSAKVLAVLMTGEIVLLGVLDAGIIYNKGLSSFPIHIALHSAFSAGAPIALLFAFSCFVGFESAALYAEETRDPQRSIPRATYFAVLLVGIFYSLSAWVAVGAEGGTAIAGLRNQDPNDIGKLYFNLMTRYVGSFATTLMGLMILLSLAAATLATHNAAARYMYALGRERLLPIRLGRLHAVHLSPSVASQSQTLFNCVVVAVFVLLGLDPYIGLASTMIGLGTTGIVLLQALAGMAVIAFFRSLGTGNWFTTRVAPAIGSFGCFVAVVLTTAHFSVLTNSNSAFLNRLPMIYAVALVIGIVFGTYLKRNRPKIYSEIAGDEVRNILMGVGIDDE
jgi:amino acid transporter